ncbi:protein FAR1-RELATED SEQUENCE 5-like [Lactuca sativa]|uniref:protein FAR1-RELATED SEQUENCE 5-like n=1 Tax=Lactuca sativa TaxID=4236 RepID=UPI000CD91EA9|nr:protein FAR1-RELATED SEQUENCE 5-like [Lactuca sativa]
MGTLGTNGSDSEEESFNCNVVDSPGGKTKLWKPTVPEEFMPDIDATYQSLEEAVEMYKLYTYKAGFGVMLNTVTRFGDKTIKKRMKMGNIIGDKDAQLVVDKMNMRKDELPNYLTIDNHKRSINIGAGLLSNESIESYRWLLEAFFKAHGKNPSISVKRPRSSDSTGVYVFSKMISTDPVSANFLKNTDFRKSFTKLVWNVYIEPKVFESRWKLLMRKFKLQDKRWFKDMYKDRKLWIPAFFKDMPLHGLMKTTSRSERVNSFFNKYSNSGNFLIYFMMNYDTAIGKRRNGQQRLEHDTTNAKHEMTLPTGLLEYAATVYTKTVFYEVKKEIFKAAWYYSIDSVEMIDGWPVVKITQTDKSKQLKIKCKVELKLPEKEVKCSCNHFIQIPEQYILRRWRRDAISSHLLAMKHVAMETEDDTFKLLTEAYSNIEYCLDHFKRNKEKLLAFVENTCKLKHAAMEFGCSNQSSSDNDEEEIIRMLGIRNIPEEINIHPPSSMRTKGSGTKKRMVSAIEKAVATAKKKTRICTGCNQYVNHNWRTCKVRLARESKQP